MPKPDSGERYIKMLVYKVRWKDGEGTQRIEVAHFGVTQDMAEAFWESPEAIPRIIEQLAHSLTGDPLRLRNITFELFEREGAGIHHKHYRVSPTTLERI